MAILADADIIHGYEAATLGSKGPASTRSDREFPHPLDD
jgi:hypothetical protein